MQASLDYVDDGESNYDQICSINLRSETGLVGRVIQDVVTKPTRKWARIQYSDGFIEWECGNLMEKIQFDGVKVKISTKRNMKKSTRRFYRRAATYLRYVDSGKYQNHRLLSIKELTQCWLLERRISPIKIKLVLLYRYY